MIRLEPRGTPSRSLALAVPACAALAALGLAAVPLMLAGAPLGRAYAAMAEGALGSRFALSEVLTRATPLILTGLSAAIAFRARLFNIGAEGQLYGGALAAIAVGAGAFDWPAPLLLPLVLFAGALAGAAMMIGPALARVTIGADEVVTTLLLNFVVLLLVQMMIEGPMKDPMSMGWPQSEPLLEAATLPRLMEKTRLHAGLLIALAAAVLLHGLMARTVAGFAIRAVGESPPAARFAGLPVGGTLVAVGALSGALAGLAGAGEVAGVKGFLAADLSPGYGYAGIVVAMLAGLSPLGTVAAALFVAAVFVGADSMSRAVNVSSYIANLIVALSLIAVLVAGLLTRYRLRRVGRPAAGA
ncbi:ABC transporter permease [Methylobacterium nonmethylotrophicum]|uniref:ABC transporter permease n=1 Tax=Methylobacterium nonmethylotrophicum TaxID=1141884 RepID=A0A4Z0NUX5_9HYPH|nr:ABC transporter permease [Methylobacterium nonmethylotrophicum]TGE01073.1 ABC transporter permease [Methylobacterium nonmethylotrophicum]